MRRYLSSLIVLPIALGCASTGVEAPRQVLSRQDRPFVIPPTAGHPRAIGSTTGRRLQEAYQVLVQQGDREQAERLAAELLTRDRDLHPAIVLAAQADFVGRDFEGVTRRLEPVVEAHPGYAAAQLLFGRSAEGLGDIVVAVEAYLEIADDSSVARDRVADLRPRAVEIMTLRIEDALSRGHTASAQSALQRLQDWAPSAERTLEIAADVAAASDDPEAELEALRALNMTAPGREDQIQRRAELELEVGDPATGMRLLEDLALKHPEDAVLEEKLARARFSWRLQLLPPETRQLASEPELERGEFAALLFWLFPEVRYGRTGTARLANDVLEHPHRDEIVRVVNLGLMEVDPSLHRFDPYRPVQRSEVLASMLSLLARRRPPFSCLGVDATDPATIAFRVCSLAATCGLIEDEADCLPTAGVSGREALGLSRQVQELLGVE